MAATADEHPLTRPARLVGPSTVAPDRHGDPGPTPRRGNERGPLVPSRGSGSGEVAFDLAGVEIGTAEYAEGPTGATVIHVPAGARTAVDRRGGAVGMSGGYDFHHALCFAGGSVYGLAAASGVADELLRRSGNRTGFGELALVSGAIIYDFSVRDNAIHPDAALGRSALGNAVAGRVPVGRVGAGVSASAGKIDHGRAEFTGQGAAFRQVGDVKVLVVTVVNSIGVIVDRDGAVVRGNYDETTGRRRRPEHDFAAALAGAATAPMHAGNTTVTAVVVNVRLGDDELGQLARQVHASMHRAIQPFHTTFDGDVLFALTTDEVDLPAAASSALGPFAVNSTAVASVAAETAWDAVLTSAN
ncbi:MAG: P1 family peptidase [Actinomycetota bacterium]|nr:P1 family peptidase [Actinomycetota bacterium]